MTVVPSLNFTDWMPTNGVEKNWPYDFTILDDASVKVLVRNDTTEEIVEYTSNLTRTELSPSSGYITYPAAGAALPTGSSVRILREVEYKQAIEIGDEGSFNPSIHEKAMDNLALQIQQVAEITNRAVLSERDATVFTLSPDISDGRTLMKSGNKLVAGPDIVALADAAVVSATAISEANAQAAGISASQSAASAAASNASAQIATTAASNASTHAANSLTYSMNSRAAAEATGSIMFFDTYGVASAVLAAIPENTVVHIFQDETHGGSQVRYRKEAGIFVLKVVYNKTITPEEFGAKGVPITKLVPDPEDDSTAALQAAFNYSRDTGAVVILGAGRKYFASSLVIVSGMTVIGGGKSYLSPMNEDQPFIILDEGAVTNVFLDNFFIRGLGGVGHKCFHLVARKKAVVPVGEVAHGGLWFSTFSRITIRNFDGDNMWLQGGAIGTEADPEAAYDYMRPHQFIAFFDCDFERPDGGNNGHSLLMTGQVNQIFFKGRNRFDGRASIVDELAPLTGANIVLSREFANGADRGGVTLPGGAAVSDIAPICIDFDGVTTQKAEYGYYIDRATIVNIKGYLENLYRAIRIEATARVNINDSVFLNAGSDGAGTGYLVRAGSNTVVGGKGNEYSGATDKVIVGSAYRSVSPDLFTTLNATGLTSGITRDLSAVGGVLNMIACRTAMVYGTTTPITTITSGLIAGSLLCIRAHGAIILASGGNLTGIPNGRMVLRPNDAAIFQRHDLGGNLVLVGVNRNLRSAAMPTTGYYEAGEEVVRDGFTPPATGAPYVSGWKRLTTGTNHVLGTDWRPILNTSAYRRVTNIAAAAVAIFDLSSLFSTRADSHLLLVSGADNSNGERSFVDIVLCHGRNAPVVIGANNQSASSIAPAARTYGISGNDLTLTMASGTYSVRVVSTSVPTGDVNYNSF